MPPVDTRTDGRKCRVHGCQSKPVFVQPGDPEASNCAAHLPQNGASFPSNNTNTNTNTDNNNNGGGGGGGSGGTNKRRRVSQSRKPAAAAAAPTPAAPRAGRSSACQIEGCGKTATHGDQRKATHCAAHKEKGMTDHKHRPCENVVPKACLKQPSFGWPGEGRKRFCGAHREAGMVDIRTCEREGCGARASHGFQKRRARFCATHCQPGMMVVANKPCEQEGCIVSPRFGVAGEKPRFCGSHRLAGMVNLKDRRCEQASCTTQPTFAFPGEKPRFCSKHKAEEMINVRHKLCHHRGCAIVPTYGLAGARVPVSCLAHRADGMVDVKRERERMSRDRTGGVNGEEAGGGGGGGGRGGAGTSAAGGGAGGRGRGAASSGGAGSVRPRLPEAPEAAEGRRRNILQAIIASSQRAPELVAAATAAAAAGRGGAGGTQQGASEGDSDESEWEEGSSADEEEDEAARNGHVLPITFPLPRPITYPPIAKTNSEAAKRLPFDESPLALLPGAVPRGSAVLAVELHVMAAVAAAAWAANGVGGADAESARDAIGAVGAGAAAGVGTGAGQVGGRQSVPSPRVLPGVSAPGGEADRGGARDANGNRSRVAGVVASGIEAPGASPGPVIGSGARESAGGRAEEQHVGGPDTRDGNGEGREGGSSAEGQKTAAAAVAADSAVEAGGTSLRWNCVQCGRPVASGDRHVLVCCGHGLLHKACTAVFTLPYYAGGGYPCPKCHRFANSSLQVFL